MKNKKARCCKTTAGFFVFHVYQERVKIEATLPISLSLRKLRLRRDSEIGENHIFVPIKGYIVSSTKIYFICPTLLRKYGECFGSQPNFSNMGNRASHADVIIG